MLVNTFILVQGYAFVRAPLKGKKHFYSVKYLVTMDGNLSPSLSEPVTAQVSNPTNRPKRPPWRERVLKGQRAVRNA